MKKIIVFIILIYIGCSKNSSTNSIPVPNLVLAQQNRANIQGMIVLYDEEGSRQADMSGVTVSIDNSSVSTQTGPDGKWKLDSIPYGTYDISYAKEGYGTGKIMGLYHAATNHVSTIISKSESMAVNSSISITDLIITPFSGTIQAIGISGVHIDPIFNNPSGKDKFVRLFFSDNPNVSASNYVAEVKIKTNGAQAQLNDFNLTTSYFESLGFKKGQIIYVKGHGDSFLSDQYTNPINNTVVFPSLSTQASKTVSFVLPNK
ncbi:carboxypeptidase-like regulatory domain-containing protein [Sediminibacterium sp.]|uniref:carboxypeptidase-like regulatory domain-containing protein n=1 Tax=Sediminibacterium sp. TaxID=1917865 RepID=UPI003F72A6DD